MLSRSEPYRDGNFFFEDGKPKYAAVLACRNNVVLIDRRKLERGELKVPQNYARPWMVYDCSNTRYYGEWMSYKTRKEAIAALIRTAAVRPRFEPNDMITGTVAEAEYNRLAALCPNP